MKIEIVLDKEYNGPDIFELAPVIPDITDPMIKVRWGNTRDELRSLNQFPDRTFTLYVADQAVLERATATFGKPVKVSPGMLERGRMMLTDPSTYDWRHFTEELKECSPRFLLLQLAANAVRKGLKPSLAGIVGNILVDGISPIDADVLIRLNSDRIRG